MAVDLKKLEKLYNAAPAGVLTYAAERYSTNEYSTDTSGGVDKYRLEQLYNAAPTPTKQGQLAVPVFTAEDLAGTDRSGYVNAGIPLYSSPLHTMQNQSGYVNAGIPLYSSRLQTMQNQSGTQRGIYKNRGQINSAKEKSLPQSPHQSGTQQGYTSVKSGMQQGYTAEDTVNHTQRQSFVLPQLYNQTAAYNSQQGYTPPKGYTSRQSYTPPKGYTPIQNSTLQRDKNQLGSINAQIQAISGSGAGADKRNLQQLFREKDALEQRLNVGRYDKDLTPLERLQLSAQGIGESLDATASVLTDAAVQAVKDTAANIKNTDYLAAKRKQAQLAGDISRLERRADMGALDTDAQIYLENLRREKSALDKATAERYATPLDMNSHSMQAMKRAMQAQQQATYGMGDTAAAVYSIGTAIADNASRLPLMLLPVIGPAVSAGLVSARIAAEKVYKAGSQGETAARALARGAVSGGIEYITEKYALDKLGRLAKSSAGRTYLKTFFEQTAENLPAALKNAGKFAGSMHRQGKTEAGEEFVSYVLNFVADKAAQDPYATFSLEDAAAAAFGGYLSGVVLGGTAAGIGIANRSKAENTADKEPFEIKPSAQMQENGVPAKNISSAVAENRAKLEQETDSAENTSIDDNPNTHTREEMVDIDGYKKAISPKMMAFINKVRSLRDTNIPSKISQPLGTVKAEEAYIINKITGVDVAGYKRSVKGDRILHIDDRHGVNGEADKSLAETEDIARMEWVMDNCDDIVQVIDEDGNQAYSSHFYDKENKKAPLVAYVKAINGVYYIVEAVPNSAKKSLQLESARILKKEVYQALNGKNYLSTDVQNVHGLASFKPNISQSAQNSNGKVLQPAANTYTTDYADTSPEDFLQNTSQTNLQKVIHGQAQQMEEVYFLYRMGMATQQQLEQTERQAAQKIATARRLEILERVYNTRKADRQSQKAKADGTEAEHNGQKTLEKVRFAASVSEKMQNDIERMLVLMPVKHRLLAETMISSIEVVGADKNSGYEPVTKKILISVAADDKYTIIHEYAHALERAIDAYNDKKFISIRNKGFDNITIFDIIEDDRTFTEPIYRVMHEKLVSVYQGRLYESYGIFDGSKVSLEGMREYFSEGYKEYITNPENLKLHDPELFDYFEGI